MGLGWDGMIIKGHRSSKSTFGAKKGNLKPAFIIWGGLRVGLPPDELLHIWKLLGGSPDLCVYRPLQHRSNRRLYTINPPYLEWPTCLATHPSTNYLKQNLQALFLQICRRAQEHKNFSIINRHLASIILLKFQTQSLSLCNPF